MRSVTVFLRVSIFLYCMVFIPFLMSHHAAGQFLNIAAQQGLTHLETGDSYGSGVSFYDFDNDGWDDLTFSRYTDSILFFRNVNGSFQELPSFVAGNGQTRHVLWADIENDGDKDLVVTTYNGTCRLFRNEGDFTFTDISQASGVIQSNQKTYGASFGDYDRDGFLDLYVCTYEHQGEPSNYPALNHLYKNNGDGTFMDVTLAAGVGDGIKLSFQGMWLDYNDDGWQDLLVINDRWFVNSLYHNNGDGTFTDVAQQAGVLLQDQDPMCLSLADFDEDGDMDLFITNSGALWKHCKLLVNQGNGTYSEESIQRGLEMYPWAWGALWVDITNNSHQDLYVCTAMPNATSDPNILMGNVGNGMFVNALPMMQGSNDARSFCPSLGDINNDGYGDIVVQNQSPYPPYLWLNQGGQNHYLKVTLEGTVSNRDAIGSMISVYFNGERRVKYTVCGENYMGQSSQHQIFGLGSSTEVDSLSVTYLSGHVDRYFNLQPDQHVFLVEGETFTAQIQPAGPLLICESSSIILDGGEHSSWLWNNGHDERFLTVTQPGEYSITVTNAYGIQAISEPVIVDVVPDEIQSMIAMHPACHGEASGSIEPIGQPGIDVSTVAWNTAGTGTLSNVPAGTYTYAFTNSAGCDESGEVVLNDPPLLQVDIEAISATTGSNGAIMLVIEGGSPPYEIWLNGAPAELENEGLTVGSYVVEVIDGNDCLFQESVVVEQSVGLDDLAQVHGLRPNPVTDVLWIENEGATDLRIHDAEGRLVLQRKGEINGPVDMNSLTPGIYFVRYSTGPNGTTTGRILKLP